MKVLLAVALFSAPALAAAPAGIFGRGVEMPVFGVDACPSSRILDHAVELTGENVLQKTKFNYTADCSQIGTGLPRDSKVPFVSPGLQQACREGHEVKCYGESSRAKTGLCIVDPTAATTTEKYGDSQRTKFKRPRFAALYAFTADGSGFQQETSWKMDGNGCRPVAGHAHSAGGSGPVDRKSCMDMARHFLGGGPVYGAADKPKDSAAPRFCDAKSKVDTWRALDDLSNCKAIFPDLLDRPRKAQAKSGVGAGAEPAWPQGWAEQGGASAK